MAANVTEDGIDIPELARRERQRDGYEVTTHKAGFRPGEVGFRVAQCTLDRWHSRKHITPRQFAAGERFRELAYATERTSGSRYDGTAAPEQYLSRTPPEALMQDAAEFRLTHAILEPKMAQELIGLCCFDTIRKMKRAEKTEYIGRMQEGLESLATRWGM